MIIRGLVVVVAAWLSVCFSFQARGQTSVSWSAAVSGNWSDSTKWNPAVVPNNGAPGSADHYAASIDATGTPYTVNLNIPAAIDSLTLSSASATVTQQAASTLSLTPGGSLSLNAGLFQMINSTISGAKISVGASATFRLGNGTLIDSTLSGNATVDSTKALYWKGTSSFSNGQVHLNSNSYLEAYAGVLSGTGQIIFDGAGTTNHIDSNTLLDLDIGAGVVVTTGTGSGLIDTVTKSSITNHGVIYAKTAGQSIELARTFAGNVYNPGSFSAANGGTLIVNKLTGDSGKLFLSGASVLDLRGNFNVSQSLTLASTNYLKLSGNFSVDQPLTAGVGSKIELGGTWTNTAAVNISTATVYLDGPYTFTQAAPFSVSASLVNFSGNFTTASVRAFFVNHNTVALTSYAAINNTGDTLALDSTTGTVTMSDAGIYGGSITATGTAKLIANSGFDYIYGVDLGSNVQISSGATLSFGDTKNIPGSAVNRATISGTGANLSLAGQWHNMGTISLNSGTLEFAGPALDMGTINLGSTAVTLKSTISMQQINSINGTMSQLYVADQGNFDLGGGVYTASKVTGSIYLNGGTIQNGTLAPVGANKVLTSGGVTHAFLDNVTLATDVTIVPNFQFTVRNGLTLSGNRITINNNLTQYYQRSGMYFTYGIQTLGGTGEIVFDGPGSAGVFEAYSSILTIGPGITVRSGNSGGYIGGDSSGVGSGDIINQGTIRADGAGHTLEFTGFNTFANPGRLEAKNGGKLLFTGVNTYIPNWTNDGTIHLETAGNLTVVGTSFTNGKTGRIEGNGTVDVSATKFVNSGYISPGLSPGLITITGNVQDTNDAVLLIQLGGKGPANYDRLVVTGTMNFAGTLDIELINGFVPSPDDQFSILTAASLNGRFDQVITHGGDFNVTYSNGQLILSGFQVPEPSTLLAGAICTGLLMSRRVSRRV